MMVLIKVIGIAASVLEVGEGREEIEGRGQRETEESGHCCSHLQVTESTRHRGP